MTFGISLAIGIPGAIVGSLGAVTMAGADIGHAVQKRIKKKDIQQSLKLEEEKMREIDRLAKKLDQQMESLAERYPQMKDERLWKNVLLAARSGKAWYDAYKVVDSGIDIARSVGTATRAARALWPTFSAGAQIFSSVGVAFDILALPVDLTVIARSSYLIHKYRTGQGHISKTAQKIDKVVEDLEEQKDELVKYYRQLCGEETNF